MPTMLFGRNSGNAGYGKPKQDFVDRLAMLSDAEYFEKIEKVFRLSAFAGNTSDSDFHWQAVAASRNFTSGPTVRRVDRDRIVEDGRQFSRSATSPRRDQRGRARTLLKLEQTKG